ncbi:MAG: tetratricopeptide repeat protein [Syntrophales bacterium]|nr:tetratricopeptide repeat protein [Syntrophales bacterium]
MKQRLVISLLLFVMTLAVFLPVYKNAFVDFDDPDYIAENPHVATGLTLKNIAWALTHYHAHNWHPLTWISHMIDVELFGLNPAGHHLMSALVHAMSAVLLYLLLYRLTGAGLTAVFVAALFALHPLRVESVAWAAERKDVLATFFFLLSLLSYTIYAQKEKSSAYALALSFHALGLTAKQMGVTLPFILLLLDYWPLKRISDRASWKKIIREKLPFFILSFGAGVTVYLVQERTGVLHGAELFPLTLRLANAVYSTVAYLGKIFWPLDLAVFYPHPLNTLPPSTVLLSSLFLFAVTFGVFLCHRPYLLVGWLWYLITLLPILGIIQVGIQGMADRYTYLPSIGILIALLFGLREFTTKEKKIKPILVGTGCLVLMCLSFLTVRQIGVWENSYTLYRHAVRVTKDNYWAYNNLGAVLFTQGQVEEAKKMFLFALSILPEYPGANKNLAAVLYREGKYQDALAHIERALQVQPSNPEYLTAKGAILAKMGNRQGAIHAFRKALQIAPEWSDARQGLLEIGEKP